MRLLIHWIIGTIALIAGSYLASAFGFKVAVDVDPWWRILVGAGLLGLLNATIGRFAKLITLPLNCLTFGLAWLLINAGIFYFVGKMDPPWGFQVGDFWGAIAGSIGMGLIGGFLHFLFKDESPE